MLVLRILLNFPFFLLKQIPIIICMEAQTMLRKLFLLAVLLLVVESLFADNIYSTIEINGVTVNGGSVYVAVYSNESDYKKETAFVNCILNPTNITLTHSLDLPEGEYVVSVFQDSNNDGKLNTGMFGIPKEPIGISKYNLKGLPPSFQEMKMPINNNSTKLIVNMGKVKL